MKDECECGGIDIGVGIMHEPGCPMHEPGCPMHERGKVKSIDDIKEDCVHKVFYLIRCQGLRTATYNLNNTNPAVQRAVRAIVNHVWNTAIEATREQK